MQSALTERTMFITALARCDGRTQMNDVRYPQRKRNRLQGYDYSRAGAYFVTVCTHRRACVLGEIRDGRMVLNGMGELVTSEWQRTAVLRPNIVLDEFVVMPNHVHGIILIDYPWLGERRPQDAKQSLERIMAGFKGACTHQLRDLRGSDWQGWQKSYHDEIIRDEQHLLRVRQYIADNPAQWALDRENPERT
jgi:putative transposase